MAIYYWYWIISSSFLLLDTEDYNNLDSNKIIEVKYKGTNPTFREVIETILKYVPSRLIYEGFEKLVWKKKYNLLSKNPKAKNNLYVMLQAS